MPGPRTFFLSQVSEDTYKGGMADMWDVARGMRAPLPNPAPVADVGDQSRHSLFLSRGGQLSWIWQGRRADIFGLSSLIGGGGQRVRSLEIIDIRGQIILLCGGPHWRMSSAIPGLFPLDTTQL